MEYDIGCECVVNMKYGTKASGIGDNQAHRQKGKPQLKPTFLF
jgi:hypothetical protein